jgi:hypothetical protein
MSLKLAIVLPLTTALASCSVTVPVAVIGSGGEVMRGTTTASLSGGTFEATNERAKCTGTYDSLSAVRTVSFAVRCSDGRVGVGRAVRDTDVSGSGTIQMNDGTIARFVFGPSAAAF